MASIQRLFKFVFDQEEEEDIVFFGTADEET